MLGEARCSITDRRSRSTAPVIGHVRIVCAKAEFGRSFRGVRYLYSKDAVGSAERVRCPELGVFASRRLLMNCTSSIFNPCQSVCPLYGGCSLLGVSDFGG